MLMGVDFGVDEFPRRYSATRAHTAKYQVFGLNKSSKKRIRVNEFYVPSHHSLMFPIMNEGGQT
jgi:hypothetical protein